MSVLYVQEQGASLTTQGGHFILSQKDGTTKKIPKELLETIRILGQVNITTACIQECLKRGVAINYCSSQGTYLGQLSPVKYEKSHRLKKQIYAFDDRKFTLNLAKKCISAKIANQLTVLRRYERNQDSEISIPLQKMIHSKKHIDSCHSIEELLGYEGSVARQYFSALSSLITTEFQFHGRSRRPPRDPFNSMLSFGYTILFNEIYAALEQRGLSPYIGFLHSSQEYHPALASDMMEEWRAVIVDSVVMSLVQGREIKIEHFYTDNKEDGVFLTNEGKKIFINKLEQKMRANANYLCSNEKAVFFRRGIDLQTLAMTKAVMDKNVEAYKPIRIR